MNSEARGDFIKEVLPYVSSYSVDDYHNLIKTSNYDEFVKNTEYLAHPLTFTEACLAVSTYKSILAKKMHLKIKNITHLK